MKKSVVNLLIGSALLLAPYILETPVKYIIKERAAESSEQVADYLDKPKLASVFIKEREVYNHKIARTEEDRRAMSALEDSIRRIKEDEKALEQTPQIRDYHSTLRITKEVTKDTAFLGGVVLLTFLFQARPTKRKDHAY